MIGIDWGTSSFRAYRFGPDGRVREKVTSADGILTVPTDGFPAVLRRRIGPWLDQGEDRVLLAGMVGSRQGWREAAYLPCPASLTDLAAAAIAVDFPGAQCRIIPGLSWRDAAGNAEVLRGEETQILGVLARRRLARATIILPGSHGKWAWFDAGQVRGFRTYLTGEAMAALGQHTILARMIAADAPWDADAFAQGVARARQPGGLLHHLFGIRAAALLGDRAEASTGAFLSGLLIGHEIEAALPEARGPLLLVADGVLAARYAEALALRGVAVETESEAAAAGLAALAEAWA